VVESEVSYEECSIYVAAADSTVVATRLKVRLGEGDDNVGLMVGPVRVVGTCNDYATGRTSHLFEFLEWDSVLECDAPAGAQHAAVVAAVTAVLETLWVSGWKAVEACDFEDELPAAGGIARYPVSETVAVPRAGGGGICFQAEKGERNSP
jgi:hypothetical protein